MKEGVIKAIKETLNQEKLEHTKDICVVIDATKTTALADIQKEVDAILKDLTQ